MISVLREYHEAVGHLILEPAATLEGFADAGTTVFCGDPAPVPSPAERAVRMAVATCNRVRALRATGQRRGYDLDLGVGIAQGDATAGAIGFEGWGEPVPALHVVGLGSPRRSTGRPA